MNSLIIKGNIFEKFYYTEKHKKNVQRHKQHLKKEQKEDQSRTGSSQSAVSDEELWARLDQLEQIELEGREIQKIGY